MAATLGQGINPMQSNKASNQGEPQDPTEATILIQATQSQLAALASSLHSPSNQMEQNLRLHAMTNCFGRIHDSITKLESIPLTSSGYETTSPPTPSTPPRETSWTDFLCLQEIEPSTGHSVYGTNTMST